MGIGSIVLQLHDSMIDSLVSLSVGSGSSTKPVNLTGKWEEMDVSEHQLIHPPPDHIPFWDSLYTTTRTPRPKFKLIQRCDFNLEPLYLIVGDGNVLGISQQLLH